MNFGMVLDKAIQIYARDFGLMIGIMAIPHALMFLMGQVVTPLLVVESGLLLLPLLLAYLLGVTVVFCLTSGAMTVAIGNRYLGKDAGFADSYRAAFARFGPLMGTTLVASLLIFLGFLVVVPGIILVVSYVLIAPVVMMENQSGTAACKRSRLLMKGYRWPALGLFLMYSVVVYVVYLGLTFGLAPVFVPGMNPLAPPLWVQLASAVVDLLIAPYPGILSVLLYYNQRIRKESFDLVLLAEGLTGSPR
jgi:hypothetical protein